MRYLIRIYLAPCLLFFLLYSWGHNGNATPLSVLPADTVEVIALTDLAWEQLDLHPDSSLQYCERAYALGQTLGYDYGMGIAAETRGIIQHNLLHWEAAAASFLRAAQHYKKAGTNTAFAGLYNNLGLLMLDTQDTLRALDYLERGLAYEMEAGDTTDIIISKINIYVLYSANGQLDKAEEGFFRILPLARAIGNRHLEQVIRSNLAVVNQRRGHYATAATQLRQLLAPGPDSIGHNQLYISITTSLAEVLFSLQQPQAATHYVQKARARMAHAGDQRYLLDLLELEIQVARSTNNLAVQLKKQERFHAVKDSLAAAENLQRIAAMNADYAYLQQREEISRLNLARALGAQQKQRERLVFATIFLGIFVISLLRYQQYRQRLLKEQAARAHQALELQFKNQQLHTFTCHLAQRNQQIQKLEAAYLKQDKNKRQLTARLTNLAILTEADWCAFQQLFQEVHPNFLPRMRRDPIGYTEGELRLAALTHLGLDRSTIANILGISPESVRKNYYRLQKKVKLDKHVPLACYLDRYQERWGKV